LASPRLTPLELQIMEVLWTRGPSAVREVQERFPEDSRPAYTTIQTVMYRLETKKVARRTHKIGNAHVFEATVARAAVQRRLVTEVLGLFGGKAQPMMAHLIQMGELTLDDVRDAERQLREAEDKGKPS
jgi:BlaI family transcriptional regulator, penicillinase repressor